jgi:hypothetical protein
MGRGRTPARLIPRGATAASKTESQRRLGYLPPPTRGLALCRGGVIPPMTPPRRLSGQLGQLGYALDRGADSTSGGVGTAGKETRPKEPTRCVSLDIISAASRRSAPSGARTTLEGGRPCFNRVLHLDRRLSGELSTARPRCHEQMVHRERTGTWKTEPANVLGSGARLRRQPRTGGAARSPDWRRLETTGPARTAPPRRWTASAEPVGQP